MSIRNYEKSNAWNIRHLVNERIVLSIQRTTQRKTHHTQVSWIEVPVCFIQDFCYMKRERRCCLFLFDKSHPFRILISIILKIVGFLGWGQLGSSVSIFWKCNSVPAQMCMLLIALIEIIHLRTYMQWLYNEPVAASASFSISKFPFNTATASAIVFNVIKSFPCLPARWQLCWVL